VTRLSTYRKTVAQNEGITPCIRYTGILKSLKPETAKFFDPYDAGPFNPSKHGPRARETYQVNPKVLEIAMWNHSKFNKTEPLTVDYTFHYKCDYETEEERIAIVNNYINNFVSKLYQKEDVSLVEGIDYEIQYVKEELV